MCAHVNKLDTAGLAPEGSVVTVPLRDRGYGVGVIARNSGDGILLVYFFGIRLDANDLPIDWSTIKPSAAIWVRLVGDLGLLNNAWNVIGTVNPWSRLEWPMPPLARYVDGIGYYKSFYDDNTLDKIREVRITETEAKQFWEDGMSGYVAAEIALTKRLSRLAP